VLSLKILGLTDLHTSGKIPLEDLQKIINDEGIDLVILAGDLTTYGSSELVKEALVEFNRIEKPVYYIPGNMDAENSGDHEFSNIHPLHIRVINYSGYNFIGLGGSNPTPFRTPFTIQEEQIATLLQQLKSKIKTKDPIILVCHTPPFESEADKIHSGKHVGSSSVKEFIEKENPVVILCGHIHESKSISTINQTLCINPGAARHRNGAVINLRKDKEGKVKATGKLIIF